MSSRPSPPKEGEPAFAAVAAEGFRASQEVHTLKNQVLSLQAENEALRDELETVRATVDLDVRDREQQGEKYHALEERHAHIKTLAGTFERQLGESKERCKDLEAQLAKANARLAESRAVAEELSEQGKNHSQLVAEKRQAELEAEQLRQELQRCASEFGRNQHRMQNDLQAARQLLEEVKLEYEQYSETSRLEGEIARRSASEQYERLREQFEEYRLREHETTQEVLSEQQQIVETLQAQFEEYRRTAEHLFLREAQRLTDDMAAAAAQHEEELYGVIKTKDRQFVDMVTAKDAKIMHLIEGTNVQREIFKHEMELEQLQRHHERDLQMAREIAVSEQRKALADLGQSITDLREEVDASRRETETWRSKAAALQECMAGLRKEHAAKEASGQRAVEEVEERLRGAYGSIEKMTQEKENLRHRLLRMRLRMQGEADSSLDSMATRLSKESARMAARMARVSADLEEARRRADAAEERARHAAQAREHSAEALATREAELERVMAAFEAFLEARVDTVTAAAMDERARRPSVAVPRGGGGARTSRAASMHSGASTPQPPPGPGSPPLSPRSRASSVVGGGRAGAAPRARAPPHVHILAGGAGGGDGSAAAGPAHGAVHQQAAVSRLRESLRRLSVPADQLAGDIRRMAQSSPVQSAAAEPAGHLEGLLDRRSRLKTMVKAVKTMSNMPAEPAERSPRGEGNMRRGRKKEKKGGGKAAGSGPRVVFRPARRLEELARNGGLVTAHTLDELQRGFDMLAEFSRTSRSYTRAAVAMRDTRAEAHAEFVAREAGRSETAAAEPEEGTDEKEADDDDGRRRTASAAKRAETPAARVYETPDEQAFGSPLQVRRYDPQEARK